MGRRDVTPFRYLTLNRQEFKKIFKYEPTVKSKQGVQASGNNDKELQEKANSNSNLKFMDDETKLDAKSFKLKMEFNSYIKKLTQHKTMRKPIIEIAQPKNLRKSLLSPETLKNTNDRKSEKFDSMLASYDKFKLKLAKTIKNKQLVLQQA